MNTSTTEPDHCDAATPAERLRRLVPAGILVLITPCLTELLSGNVPAATFFQPPVFLPLLLVYGMPVLLIRELWVRWNLDFHGLFCLGLAYGIYNEGIIAQTLRLGEHVPIGAFDGYRFLGLNWPWTALILPWHALHTIIFPVAIVTWLFPGTNRDRWLSPAWSWTCGGILLVFGTLVYFTNRKMPSAPSMLGWFLATIGLLVRVARSSKAGDGFLDERTAFRASAAVAGFIFYPLFVLSLAFLSAIKLPGLLVCVASGLILAVVHRLLSKAGWFSSPAFLLFVFGDYLAAALATLLGIVRRGSLVGVLMEVGLASACCAGILSILFAPGTARTLRAAVRSGKDPPPRSHFTIENVRSTGSAVFSFGSPDRPY